MQTAPDWGGEHQLLDFGEGRRLERFGPVVLDRPCPAAEKLPRSTPELWNSADARFERTSNERGQWLLHRALPDRWTLRWRYPLFELQFELKRTEFGHVGLFPEHAAYWPWLAGRVEQGMRVLNLFAHTGGSTLAVAAAEAEVVHVDAARNVVAWARRNAALSGLADAPVRWIVEDARKFCKRELRRGAQYEGVLLDPPSYGHGPRGEVWRLGRDLPRLLELCAQLTTNGRQFILLTCHTPGFDAERLGKLMSAAFATGPSGRIETATMLLRTPVGRALPAGVAVKWERE